MGIRHTCKRRFFLRWGLRRVRGRKSPEKPHNPWHQRDHTLCNKPEAQAKGIERYVFSNTLPMNFPAWRTLWGDRAEAVSGSSLGRRREFPLTPSIANRCQRIWFLSVMHDHRPVARWRPPRSTYLLRGQRTELEAHRRRLPLQRLQHIGLHLGLVLFHRLRDKLLAVLEHPVDQTRQLVRGRLDCSASADPAADAAVEQAHRRHCPAQRLRTHPQRDGHSVGALAMAAAFLRLVALILRRT